MGDKFAIASLILGAAITVLFVFLERTGMLKKPWALGILGVVSILLFATGFAILWHVLYSLLIIIICSIIGILWVLSVVYKGFREQLLVIWKRSRMLIILGSVLIIGGVITISLGVTRAYSPKTITIQTTTSPLVSQSVITNTVPTKSSQTTTFTPPFTFPNFVDASQINPSQEVDIVWGTNTFVYKWSDFTGNNTPMTIASLGGLVPFNPHIFGSKLYLDVSVWDGTNFTPITIKDNIANVLPANWDKNYDDYAYEVVNEEGDPIFQIIYETQFKIVVNGIFPFPGGIVIADDSGIHINAPFDTLHLKPIFKYPSKDNQGVRIIYG
jgi:hypothetical protein